MIIDKKSHGYEYCVIKWEISESDPKEHSLLSLNRGNLWTWKELGQVALLLESGQRVLYKTITTNGPPHGLLLC